MMDQDFPMSRRQGQVLVVGLVAMAVVGVALFGGWIPGVHPGAGGSVLTYQGRPYFWTFLTVPYPLWPANTSGPVNYTFHGAALALGTKNWYALGGGELVGTIAPENATPTNFTLTAAAPTAESPNATVVLEWPGGILLYFLVLVPPTSST